MAVTRQITKIMRTALASLLVCATVAGCVASYFDGSISSGLAFAAYSFVFGAPVVVVYGVPVYSIFHSHGRANWLLALLAGLLPGAVLAPFYWQFAAIVAVFGMLVATAVRWVHGPGPNSSFKPKPLRGSA